VRGYITVWAFDPASGRLGDEPVDRWETPTSGGKANAIEFAPQQGPDASDFIVLTDDEQGFVVVLEWDGMKLAEVARTKLDEGTGASHAVWLR
jgi:carboxy-cis,cis-muconate cyclase